MNASDSEATVLPFGPPRNSEDYWSAEDEADLRREFSVGTPVEELAALFARSPEAVRARLNRMGMLTPTLPDVGSRTPATVTMMNAVPRVPENEEHPATAASVAYSYGVQFSDDDKEINLDTGVVREIERQRPVRRRPSVTTMRPLADVAQALPGKGRAPSTPLLQHLSPRFALRTVRALISGAVVEDREPQKFRAGPTAFEAARPANHRTPQWVLAGAWLFRWDGKHWTGDRMPNSNHAAWWPDPYGPGVRWWDGKEWTSDALRSAQGWVPVQPGEERRYVWWDGDTFGESFQTFPLGSRVRPTDRSNSGELVGVDRNQRDKPVLVHFVDSTGEREAVINFPAEALQKI